MVKEDLSGREFLIKASNFIGNRTKHRRNEAETVGPTFRMKLPESAGVEDLLAKLDIEAPIGLDDYLKGFEVFRDK